jgi:transposase-like protein
VAPRRRLPVPSIGLDVNFCRNIQCSQFGMTPDPFDGRGRRRDTLANFARGSVVGSDDAKAFRCGACGQHSIIKNNRAIVEEYRRLRRKQTSKAHHPSCRRDGCPANGRSLLRCPELYRRSGQTAGRDQRWKCKSCGATFSVGKPARRQKRSDKNGQVLRLLVNGTPIAKIAEILGLSHRDVYRKLDFIYERVCAFTAEREGTFEGADWQRHGRRFATDSQTLTLNWPSKRTRAPVAVHHLCTAHANSGYIVAAHLQLDPAVDLPAIEGQMSSVGDFALPRAFRSQARVWSKSEFSDYIDKITREVVISKWEAPEVEEGLQLPHCGALIRQDIMQLSHAFFLRKMLGKGEECFVFVLDADSGLALAFASAFATRIQRGLADILVVAFDKHKSNDERNSLVADGKALFEADTGFSRGHLDALPADQAIELLDAVIQLRMWHEPVGAPFLWPYHTKSEPLRTIRLLTDRPEMERARRARLMRLATLRSVDSYFHKVRRNLRFASRPAHTPSGNGRAWDRHYLYKPQTMVKLVEIYRFSHNWMGARQTKETPAMKLGLARGKIYERDLFAG